MHADAEDARVRMARTRVVRVENMLVTKGEVSGKAKE